MGKSRIISPSRIASRLLSAFLILLPAVVQAQSANTPLLLPSSVAYDGVGDLYFAETGNHVVRRLTPAGVLAIVAGTGTQGYAGDSGAATAALLDSPSAIALNGAGDLFIADTHNRRIRRVDAVTGIISTYAVARLPVALAFNPLGALVYADAATHQVMLIQPGTGQASVIAGSGTQGFSGDGALATAASLDTPSGLAFDAAGDLYIADAHNHRVRRVDAATGIITTAAGTGQPGFSGDGAPATGARLDLPRGLSLDAAGNLFIADSRNQRIRRVDAATGLVTTIAGDGTQGFSGDGSSAGAASLDTPRAVASPPAAGMTLADSGNDRVRQVDGAGHLLTIAGAGAISPARTASATLLTQTASATLDATVSAASAGTPTGMASLIDGATPVATASLVNGAASFSTGILSAGSHTLTASYSGSATLLPSTSQPLIFAVGNSAGVDFTLIASAPASVTTVAGSAATFTLSISPTGGALTSAIDLSDTGAPPGSTASFNPAVIPPPSGPTTFTLTVDTPASARMESAHGGQVLLAAAFLLPLAWRRRRRGVCLLALLLLTGCGARVNGGNPGAPQPITYILTVSATATSPTGATLLHTAQVTLVVQ
jgi:sugar lactone lactonase YvrE